ncbi:amidohydrolase [Gammaproteobacteria bacterium]|nr:amidohydrolase [Gammaproteobacteria bacterium]
MTIKRLVSSSLLILLSISSMAECIFADLILANGTVYTGNKNQPIAKNIAIKDSLIVDVSNNFFDKDLFCETPKIIDLTGQYIFPGFVDAHGHLKGIGYRELTLNLQGINSLNETLETVKKYVLTKESGEWIVGRGWIDKIWPEKRFPTKQDLDIFSPENPVVLERADGHAIVANSLALDLANITSATPDPQGGFIEQDAAGELTGLLVDTAMSLITDLTPKPSLVMDKEAFLKGLQRNVSLGWTQIHTPGATYDDIGILKEIKSQGELLQRVYVMVDDGLPAERLLDEGPLLDPDNYLIVRTIKMYSDGALGSRGAALLEKYDDYDGNGHFIFLAEETKPKLLKALKSGIQIATHAIGDHANRVVLDWYEEAFRIGNNSGLAQPRWRIEHSQNIMPIDQKRFLKLGIIPSMQPSHAIGDLHFAVDRLGLDRIDNAYAWRDLIDLGLIIPGGTDAPVEIGDPLIEFYAAVTRKDVDGFYDKGWNLNQRVTREEALKMFTIWPAIASFQEDVKGTIEKGKLADLTVFNKNLMTIPDHEILESKNILTIVGGREVFSSLGK